MIKEDLATLSSGEEIFVRVLVLKPGTVSEPTLLQIPAWLNENVTAYARNASLVVVSAHELIEDCRVPEEFIDQRGAL